MSTHQAMARAVEALGSQKRLAEAVGVSQQWVSDVKRGKIASISVEDAFAIERATGGAVRAEEFAGVAPAPETDAEPGAPAAASQPPAERRSPAGGALPAAAGAAAAGVVSPLGGRAA